VDGRVRLWDLARDRRLVHAVPLGAPFEADGFTPRGVAMSPDGTTLAVTQGDGTVDLVDTASLARRDTVRTGPGAALAVAFSPDGRLLAVSGEHGRVGLWDARTLAPVGRLEGLQSWTQALAFSPDSRRLAASDTNFDPVGLRMWDVRRRTVTGFRVPGAFNAVAFSPHGRVLAAAGAERGTEVRDVRTGRLVVRLQAGELARSVAFSPDGRLLFTGLLDGSGQFYSTRTWRPVGGRVRGQGQRILNPVFTPDGRTLATSSADGTVLLWDVATRRPIGAPYMVQRESFVAAAMSRDGASVYGVPTGANGVRIALSPQEWQRQACAIAGRELSRREWRELLPSRPYEPVCAGVQG
jgi:WD40 repeat protein